MRPPVVLLFPFFLLCLTSPAAVAALDTYSTGYPDCPIVECGDFNISYPFWVYPNAVSGAKPSTYCGYRGLNITCDGGNKPVFHTLTDNYTVKSVNKSSNTISLIDANVVGKTCPRAIHSVTIQNAPALNFTPDAVTITFYFNCSSSTKDLNIPDDNVAGCLDGEAGLSYIFNSTNPPSLEVNTTLLKECKGAPIESRVRREDIGRTILGKAFGDAMNKGFDLTWNLYDNNLATCKSCELAEGRCGSLNTANGNEFHCFTKKAKGRMSVPAKILIFTGGLFVAAAACVLTCCIWKYSSRLNYLLGVVDEDQSVEAFLETQKQLALPRYQFSSIKRITSSFSEKLGEGGYGSVFKGKLDDGSLVAVKILNNPNGTGEEFINEVASTCRTNHVNIVSLLGFCSQGSKRALVYEYMPNGSLEKYLFHNDSNTTQLGWEQLYKIAVGIAKGLEYLHRGCKTRIVHFDIKPHNILLDEDLCPKISDFGLAKFCPPKESVLSMVCARGTIGYIAPEVFSRNFGLVTSKSDVYSYGMMVLEMAGGRKNSDLHADNSSEMYFPHWIYDHLDKIGELKAVGLPSLPVETEEVAKKMIMVGLWCIQTNPACRPSINRVVEMLEGRVEDIEMPPRQYLCSPPRPDPAAQEINSYTTSISQS